MNKENVILAGCKKLVDGYVWNSMLTFNGLMKMNIRTGELSFVGCFPEEDATYQLHLLICEYCEKLVFVPWNTNNIAIYDISAHEFRRIAMKEYGYPKAGRFWVAAQADEKLYMASENAKEIVEFDMQKEMIENIHVFSGIEEYNPSSRTSWIVKTKHDIWKICGESETSWKFNMMQRKFERISFCYCGISVLAVCGSNDAIWILDEKLVLYRFTLDGVFDKEYSLSEIIQKNIKMEKRETLELMCSQGNDNIFLVRYDKSEIVKIPLKNNTIEIGECQNIPYKKADLSLGDQLIMSESGKLICFEGDIQREIVIQKSERLIEDILKVKNKRLIEGGCIELDDFIQCILQRDITSQADLDDCEETCGSRIYDAVYGGI